MPVCYPYEKQKIRRHTDFVTPTDNPARSPSAPFMFQLLAATPDQILNYQANGNLLANPTGLDFIDENIPERIRQARLPSLEACFRLL